jgi:hypothetical protein
MVAIYTVSLTTGVEMVESPNTIKPSLRAINFNAVETSRNGGWTEWRVDVHEGGSVDQRQYTLNLDRIHLDATIWWETTGSPLYRSLSAGAIRVTPSPRDYIEFRPGDMLGFYVIDLCNVWP